MKNKNHILSFLSLIFIIIFVLGGQAQNTYLKIYEDYNNKKVKMYPPGTQFELKNEHNQVVLKANERPSIYDIDGSYTLIVYPSYKSGKDIYKLNKGRIELALTKDFGKSKRKGIYIDKNKVTAHKSITNSKQLTGQKNLIFELSNGIIFTYTDGKYLAKLDGKYLNVTNKYIVRSKIGILKLSFNPNNGEVWWIFDKNE